MVLRIGLVMFAICIDGLEFMIELALTALGATGGGTVAGAVAGAAACAKLGTTVAGACAAAGGAAGGVVGFFAQWVGAGEVVGFVLGYVLSVAITFSFGVALVTALVLTGNFKLFATGYVFAGKLIPILGLAPGWTAYAWHCTGGQARALSRARQAAGRLTRGFTDRPDAQERQMRTPFGRSYESIEEGSPNIKDAVRV